MYTAKESLYIDETRTRIVPEGSVESAFLLVAKGQQLPDAEAQKYGLLDEPEQLAVQPESTKEATAEPGGEVAKPERVVEEKAKAPAKNKANPPADNK